MTPMTQQSNYFDDDCGAPVQVLPRGKLYTMLCLRSRRWGGGGRGCTIGGLMELENEEDGGSGDGGGGG